MFTVETNFDHSKVTVLDSEDEEEDIIVEFYDDSIFIRQWDDELAYYNFIVLSPEMFDKMLFALQCPDGAYSEKINEINR
jgi:hypothetical protein